MSLTKPFRTSETTIKTIIGTLNPGKDKFYSIDGAKCFEGKKTCAIPSTLEMKYQAGLCGTAFDYLARFCIARICEFNRENVLKNMISERLISSSTFFYKIKIDENLRQQYINSGASLPSPEEIIVGKVSSYKFLTDIFQVEKNEIDKMISSKLFNIESAFNSEDIKCKLLSDYNELLKPVHKYINGCDVSENTLVEICLILAKMEHLKRDGKGAIAASEIFRYDSSNDAVKNELKRLLASFKKTFLPLVRKESIVIYNPHFGIGSRVIGGADADIYIDGVLYDFKTTVKNGWSSADATQVIGYYLLDKIAKVTNDNNNYLNGFDIKKVALYKVRYEEIAYFNTDELSSEDVQNAVLEICHTYLMYNLFYLLPRTTREECIRNYKIPLSLQELRDYCTDQAAEELKWLSKNNATSEYAKNTIHKTTSTQRILCDYLKNSNIVQLMCELALTKQLTKDTQQPHGD